MKKWLEFIKDEKPKNRKTDIYQINNISTKVNVGNIRWYGGFRKYIFAPNADFIYDAGCLTDISDFLNVLMLERKIKK